MVKEASLASRLGLPVFVRSASQTEAWQYARIRADALVSGARRPRPDRTPASDPYSVRPAARNASS
jgi:hypothetical protein